MTEASSRIEVVVGDITTLQVDAIVNAANRSLLGGGGVDGAIHRAAGPGLLDECRALGGCATGEARMTRGYDLPASHVIHTVGPVWHGDDARAIGGNPEDDLLALCYASSLTLAAVAGLSRVAFPSISTGAFGFPKRRAARIAVDAVLGFLTGSKHPERVLLCAFSEADGALLREMLASRT